MDKITHKMRLQQWIPIVRECNVSNETVRNWCMEHGIDIKKYYYWQRKIRAMVAKQTPSKIDNGEKTFIEIPTTALAVIPTKSATNEYHQPDAVLQVGNISISVYNSASQELVANIGMLLNNA